MATEARSQCPCGRRADEAVSDFGVYCASCADHIRAHWPGILTSFTRIHYRESRGEEG